MWFIHENVAVNATVAQLASSISSLAQFSDEFAYIGLWRFEIVLQLLEINICIQGIIANF